MSRCYVDLATMCALMHAPAAETVGEQRDKVEKRSIQEIS